MGQNLAYMKFNNYFQSWFLLYASWTPAIFLRFWANPPGNNTHARIQNLNLPGWNRATHWISLTFHFPSVKWAYNPTLQDCCKALINTVEKNICHYWLHCCCYRHRCCLGFSPIKKNSDLSINSLDCNYWVKGSERCYGSLFVLPNCPSNFEELLPSLTQIRYLPMLKHLEYTFCCLCAQSKSSIYHSGTSVNCFPPRKWMTTESLRQEAPSQTFPPQPGVQG